MRGCNNSNVSGQKKKKKRLFLHIQSKENEAILKKKIRQNVFNIKMIKPIFKKFSEKLSDL